MAEHMRQQIARKRPNCESITGLCFLRADGLFQILFMNKTDLLRKKLQQGVRVKKYIPEYDKANDYETVSTCKDICLLSIASFLRIQ